MSTTCASQINNNCTRCPLRLQRAFCNLGQDALREFDSIGFRMDVPKGAVLFHEADKAESVLVLCTGQVKLSCTSRDGRTLIHKIAMAGDVLGLGAVISGARFEVTCETIVPCTVKKISRRDMLRFLERHGEASMHAAKALSEEYKSAFFDARRLALSSSAAGKLAGVLMEWANAAQINGELRFTMALTHEDLASLAGLSRETVTRTLGKFQREKLLSIRGTMFHILEPQRMADLAA
ncbi:helix-turn-helix domain-containing protein [Granulicella sp. 5B5]|uniref:Crp/Fnr family transcriptional regulator n=1 Tax=Granulicella sp. 5B5 TaxID=1617967 RepID=UPI0015F673D1|nr:Crp/Fnr family transcriptional regulator [Granulicella sp. 5B5]QMV19647.1 helix-turn-helix domain-containing protein [Granulicella sp. 5B5]